MGSACVTVDGCSAAVGGDCNGCLGCEGEVGEWRGGVAELCWGWNIGDLFCALLEGFGTYKEGKEGKEGEAERGLSGGGGWRRVVSRKKVVVNDDVCCCMEKPF